ncbi:activated protein kinase catalytic subunit alpha-1 [Seminavis robusta]|uniref:Guanylate cyclase n=1 Tax=Seminavis robusta TaxID=568900 RepID=A0A9N8DCM2_9STRA|nr:activated protein kinase catalytic subunit alpha-1 [Seminavis robusta]|eukprot:Sro91_g047770.1 activated protein kinase catalytic subunit alpha-1 (1982) ;mRNA; f:75831-83448
MASQSAATQPMRSALSRTAACWLLLLLLCSPSSQAQTTNTMDPVEISYVMEPFEALQEEWIQQTPESWDVTLTTTNEALFGNASLQVDFVHGSGGNADDNAETLTLGWTRDQGEPPHNCHGSTHLSLWYKIIPTASARVAQLRVVMLSDNDQEYYHDTFPLKEETSWQEFRVDIENQDLKPLHANLTSTTKLDLTRLTGWRLEVGVVANEEDPENNAQGTLLLDQLACVGGGDLLAAPFHLNKNNNPNMDPWDFAIQEGIWGQSFLDSEYARNETSIALDGAGVMQVNYTIEQTESWGGLVGMSFKAPANAYYNLTGATHIGWGFQRRQPASVAGRTNLRFILKEASHACHNCSFEDWEWYYSFHYMLDEDDNVDGLGEVLMPLEGGTSSEMPFWLTGWSGALGDEQLDVSYIRGFGLELNLDSQGGLGSTVSGAIDIFNMTVLRASPGELEEAVNMEDEGPAEVAYVLEPFESMDAYWLTRESGDDGDVLNVTFTAADNSLFGNSSLSVEYRFGAALDTTRKMEVGRIAAGPPFNCHRASYVSLWYRMLETTESGQAATARLLLLDYDDAGFYVDLPEIVDQGWREFKVNISAFLLNDAPGGTSGDAILDLKRLRGWTVELRGSTMASGVIFLDQLACVGGENMLGSEFSPPGESWNGAVNEGSWTEDFYNSDLSESVSKIALDDGILGLDYTIEQVESWGGYIAFMMNAPEPSYYNLSSANFLRFGYRIREAASIPGRAHLRMIVVENSHGDEERYYNFNYVLDENLAVGDIEIPLEGSADPSSPLWQTGWSGGVGNSQFDKSHIKGFTFELSMDSQGDLGSTASGAIDLFGLTTPRAASKMADNSILDFVRIVEEPGVTFSQISPRFRRQEFKHSECQETCASDPSCNYALANGQDCFTASTLEAGDVLVANTPLLQDDVTAFWVDDVTRRGDYCDLCDCHGLDQTIDCRNKDLIAVPKTFSLAWKPRVLDLRNNSQLVLLGAGALDGLAESLEVLWLPSAVRHISPGSLTGLPYLSVVHFEPEGHKSNVILESSQAFDDVCCSIGQHIDLSVPMNGFTFCDMKVKRPGSDSTFLDFVQFEDGNSFAQIRPNSDFMAEAAESPEKCAEYCAISSECAFYSYDARWHNAAHICYHMKGANGTMPEHNKVCCENEHYADEGLTMPGWTSGMPPRTRHDLDNARVQIEPGNLVADFRNGYEVEYTVSLGSTPLRGAVWVEPRMSSSAKVDISFSPTRVILYGANTTATVKVSISSEAISDFSSTLLITNKITSCDAAFMHLSDGDLANDLNVFIDVVTPKEESGSNLAVPVTITLAIVCMAGLAVLVYFERKRKSHDAVWQVKEEELKFADPPDIVGRGSFGLVLRATYRGTAVAVKRVIPPRRTDIDNSSHRFGSGQDAYQSIDGHMRSYSKPNSKPRGADSMPSLLEGKALLKLSFLSGPSGRDVAEWRKRRQAFVKEMRYLSKLRHPCITTVMGAVIDSKSEPMLVMELMEHGSLYDLLQNETLVMEEELRIALMADVTQGMRFLHAANVIHGDLKAANILVDKNFRAKVADFGLSSHKDHGRATGTPLWMAPELLRGDCGNSTASDVFSFGIILYECWSRKEPYEGEQLFDVLRLVTDRTVHKRPPFPDEMPAVVRSLMSDCLAGPPERRPSFEELDQRVGRVNVDSTDGTPSRPRRSSVNANTTTLFDIFPRHVAEALQDGKKVEAEHKDCVTIFFSDIVGFTNISTSLEPHKIASMLDRLYTKLDELSQQHDIYKVETIGDAYMAVSNLIKDQHDDHVKRIALFAVDAVDAANTVKIDLDNPARGCVQIRCGFHSGPVVADVVGSRNPRYCLFGDAVNTASRMESNGQGGRIHCSRASAELLEAQLPQMAMNGRGEIHVKGKGMMETFWCNEEGMRPSEQFPNSHTVQPHKNKSMRFLNPIRGSANRGSANRRQASMRGSGTEETSNGEVGGTTVGVETSLSLAEAGRAPTTFNL